jgi:hypothetical protein
MEVSLSKEFNVQCPHCGRLVSYSQRYDSYFCMPCNLWLEQQCSEPLCEFCMGRSKEPDGAQDLDVAKPEVAEHAPPVMPKEAGHPAVGRNRPCPCSSGVKYKKCCGRVRAPSASGVKAPLSSGAHFLSRLRRLV